MIDKHFLKLATEKGEIVSAIKHSMPNFWVWLIIEEGPERIVVEFRRIVP